MTSTEMIKDFLEHVGQGYGRDWCGLIVFERHAWLSDWAHLHMNQLLGGWAEFNEKHRIFRWKSGERLCLAVVRDTNDYWTYHGHSYLYMAIVKETHLWPREQLKTMLRCNNRPLPHELGHLMKFVSVRY